MFYALRLMSMVQGFYYVFDLWLGLEFGLRISLKGLGEWLVTGLVSVNK